MNSNKKGMARTVMVLVVMGVLLSIPLVLGADSATDTFTASATLGNTAPVVSAVTVQNAGTYDPTSCSTTAIAVRFTVTDNDGWETVNLTSGNCTVSKDATEVVLGGCTKISNSSATEMLVECTGNMQYYYATGNDWATVCAIEDNEGSSDSDTAGTPLTFNRLESISITGASISWSALSASSTDVGADDDPTDINNCGNAYFANVNTTAYDLIGDTNASEYMQASDFSVNIADASEGDALANATASTVTGSSLLIGSGADEQLYFYLEAITNGPLEVQSYSSSSPWEIEVYNAADANP